MGRIVGNWLAAYQEYSKESESPDSYHVWSALSVIASAVRRNVYLDQGIFRLYPNIFVILVGPPGKVSKTTSIRLGRKILFGLEDIVFGPDSISMEDLVQWLAKAGKVDGEQSALTLHSGELSSLLEISGLKMIQFLTDIYDNDDSWKRSTKHQGRDEIKNPVVNILAATTPSYIAEGLPADVVGHGFTSRVIFVYEEEPRFLNPRPKEPDQNLKRLMIEDLKTISELKGTFSITDEAEELYDTYYRQIYANPPKDYRIEGYYWRKAKVHLLKIAMLISLSENDDLVIRASDLEAAWQLLDDLEDTMHKTFSAVGKYDYASDLERIYAQILDLGGMESTEIYQRNYAVGGAEDLGGILHMLVMMGQVRKEVRGDKVMYLPI
jgi:hypothetical protein